MNIAINPATYLQECAARRQRLMNPPNAVKQVEQAIVTARVLSIVTSYRDSQPKDAHVRAWRDWMAGNVSPCKNHIKRRCEELGVLVEDVVSNRRSKKIVRVRHLIMWEIKTTVKPDISYPELGRLFGGRDHSTCIHSIRKVAAERAMSQ